MNNYNKIEQLMLEIKNKKEKIKQLEQEKFNLQNEIYDLQNELDIELLFINENDFYSNENKYSYDNLYRKYINEKIKKYND